MDFLNFPLKLLLCKSQPSLPNVTVAWYNSVWFQNMDSNATFDLLEGNLELKFLAVDNLSQRSRGCSVLHKDSLAKFKR